MVVQHNLTAMNANRMLGITTGLQAKSSEKLSSGYRINRAADDAAGLTISEKMRKQVRGLTQASTNAQDGISCVQTAEGALTEVHSMLQRMNELAVQASNGTLSDTTDRKAIQDEIDQLVTEIDRVSETTKFNDIYLLKGGDPVTTSEMVKDPVKVELSIKTDKEFKEVYTLDIANGTNGTYYAVDAQGASVQLTDAMTADDVMKYINADGTAKDGYKIYSEAPDAANEFGVQLTEVDVDAGDIVQSSTGLMDDAGAAVKAEDLKNYFDANGVYKGGLYSRLSADNAGVGNTGNKGDLVEIGADQINTFVDVNVTPAAEHEVKTTTVPALEFKLHVGSESAVDNKITVSIDAMSSAGIGVDVLKETGLMTQDDATSAIDTISEAIQHVSKQRSALGAVQNRLEHTIANLDNVVENTTAAESRIRDTDMAKEMVEYSKNNILAQAGQSMLAQANQSTQGVLSLLQ